MQKSKSRTEDVRDKLIKGIKIGRQKMLEEKSMKGQYVIFYEDGKIKREKASEILKKGEEIEANYFC